MLLGLLSAEFTTYAVPGTALIISMATLVISTIMTARRDSNAFEKNRMTNLDDEIADLKARVTACEEGRASLQREVDRLTRREFILMQRLLKLEENGT